MSCVGKRGIDAKRQSTRPKCTTLHVRLRYLKIWFVLGSHRLLRGNLVASTIALPGSLVSGFLYPLQ